MASTTIRTLLKRRSKTYFNINPAPVKKVLRKLKSRWMTFARRLARVQTVIIVTLFYFLVISPMGYLMSLFGWDPLGKRGFHKSAGNKTQPTNWQQVKKRTIDTTNLRRMS